MIEQIKIITSRRAYEFANDELRLSALCTQPIQSHIQRVFQFQATTMGSPMPTFGEVPASYPPGIVFDVGAWVDPENNLVPIRFLHIEQRRIVIDIAGAPSSAIDGIFEQFQQALSQLHTADGSSVLGEVTQVKEYSEITAHFSVPIEKVLPQSLRQLFVSTASIEEGTSLFNFAFSFQKHSAPNQTIKMPFNDPPHSFILAYRADTLPEEQIYFSGAPLASEEHLNYLREFDAILQKLR